MDHTTLGLRELERRRIANVMQMWHSGALDYERTPGNKNIAGLLCRTLDEQTRVSEYQAGLIEKQKREIDKLLGVSEFYSRVFHGPLIPLLKLWWRERAR